MIRILTLVTTVWLLSLSPVFADDSAPTDFRASGNITAAKQALGSSATSTAAASEASRSNSIRSALGGISAGGGDEVGLEFTNLGQLISRFFLGMDRSSLPVDPNTLSAAVTQTIVRSDVHAYLGGGFFSRGEEVDAVNFPSEGRILVSRSRWAEYRQDQKVSLVLHEYLSVMGLNDRDYQISAPFLREHGKAILIAGTPVTRCTTLAVLSLYSTGESGKPVASMKIQTLVFNRLKPASPFDAPEFASPSVWVDFNEAVSSATKTDSGVSLEGDAALLQKALGALSLGSGKHEVASILFQADEADRVSLFAVISPNFSSTERYGQLDRKVDGIAAEWVDIDHVSYQARQSFELHCQK